MLKRKSMIKLSKEEKKRLGKASRMKREKKVLSDNKVKNLMKDIMKGKKLKKVPDEEKRGLMYGRGAR
jgi:hypothetical protein